MTEDVQSNRVEIKKAESLSNTAKLLRAYMKVTGIACAKTLAADLDIPVRTIQRLKLDVACAMDGAASATATCATSATDGAATSANDATGGGCVDNEQKEIPPKPPKEKTTTFQEQPSHSHNWEARAGEINAGHGVMVNCDTIRHPSFAISLPGIRMNTIASGFDAEAVKTHCVAFALQWAAEIENGKRPDAVVPGHIANFLSASIMGAKNRAACQDVRMERAKTGPASRPLGSSFADEKIAKAKAMMAKLGGEARA